MGSRRGAPSRVGAQQANWKRLPGAGRQEEAVATCQTLLTRARTWAAAVRPIPGGQEHALDLRSHGDWAVANLALCTVSIPGSWAPGPNNDTAWDWHSPWGRARAQGAHQASPTGPDPTPPQKSQITPMLRGLHLYSPLPTPQCGSHGVKNTQDQNSLSSQGNMRFLISSGAAAHDPAGDPRPPPGSPAPFPCSHALDCFRHLPIC